MLNNKCTKKEGDRDGYLCAVFGISKDGLLGLPIKIGAGELMVGLQ